MRQLGEAPYNVNFFDDDDLARIKSGFKNPEVESSAGIAISNGTEVCEMFLDMLAKKYDQQEWQEVQADENMRILKNLQEQDIFLLSFGLFYEENTVVLADFLHGTILDTMWGQDSDLDTLKFKAEDEGGNWLVFAAPTTTTPLPCGMVFLKPSGFYLQKFRPPGHSFSCSEVFANFHLLIQNTKQEDVIKQLSHYKLFLIKHINRFLLGKEEENTLDPPMTAVCGGISTGRTERSIREYIETQKSAMSAVNMKALPHQGAIFSQNIKAGELELEWLKYHELEKKFARTFIFDINKELDLGEADEGIVVEDSREMVVRNTTYWYSRNLDRNKKDAIRDRAGQLNSIAKQIIGECESDASKQLL